MKKIFAIALALVMVLSMASAFASACTTGFDWTVASVNNCGKAKVEIVPYVKVADGCGSYTWKVSDCAGFVPSEKVFYAVKLTVDANPDFEWLAAATLTWTAKGMAAGTEPSVLAEDIEEAKATFDSDKEEVYYYSFEEVTATDPDTNEEVTYDAGWLRVGKDDGEISVADDVEMVVDVEDEANHPFITSAVSTGKPTKLCVTLASEFVVEEGEAFAAIVGKYYVVYGAEDGTDAEFEKFLLVFAASDLEDGVLPDDAEPIVVYGINKDKVDAQIKVTETCAPYTVADVEAFLGLDNNSNVTDKLVGKNFGWDDEQEDCFEWTATSAIVDAECVVAIPKTGDASLLAWLF